VSTKPTIFISHSTGSLPDTDPCVQVRNALVTELTLGGWDVFLDSRSVQPGDRWRAEILYRLATAQACIILMNQEACASTWVKDEALIMCFRRSITPALPVVPVVFPGAKIEDTFLKTHEPFQFNENQRVPFVAGASPAAFAKSIAALSTLDATKHLPPKSAAWVKAVAGLFSDLKPDIFVDADLPLQLDHAQCAFASEVGHSRFLSLAVANWMHLKENQVCVDAAGQLIKDLPQEKQLALRDHLIAKWVVNQSVEMLLYALRQPELYGWLTLNTDCQDIAKWYHTRASAEIGSTLHKISVLDPKGDIDKMQDLIDLVESALRAEFFDEVLEEAGFGKDDLPAAVAEHFKPANTYGICFLRAKFNRADVISVLRQRYPRIVFFVLAGKEQPALTPEARPLKPLLNDNNRIEFSVYQKRCKNLVTLRTA
jgi:hypothetical protein